MKEEQTGSEVHDLVAAQELWKDLYAKKLPSAAKERQGSQKVWPVSLDHCFARIILDNAVGKDVPWMAKLKSPAYKHMDVQQLQDAIDMAHGILAGKLNLVDLNRKSLELRNKKGPNRARMDVEGPSKRKERDSADTDVPITKSEEPATKKPNTTKETEDPAAAHDFNISIVEKSSDLTPFRRDVLLLLYTVPKGQWTTYKAMSNRLKSSPRAVGNAMRNNPYAPMVPCHRVLASDASIGGFGGDWGTEGKHSQEKLRLLRSEGVKFDGKGKAVGKPYSF